jgi:iron complex outermembrane recepter protein
MMNKTITKTVNSLILAIFGIMISANVMAQSILRGTVRDAQNAVVPGASVTVLGTNQGTTSNADGAYSLKLNNGTYNVRYSFIGFETVTKSIIVAGETVADIAMVTSSTSLDEVVISVGSRGSQRTVTDTPLPIDILSARELSSTGQTTFDKALTYRVPSFNTVQTPVNDATSLMDPYEIRNMGPSRTLILINGKRKNMSSLVYVQTSPGRGETGADISAIPTDAIKRVEILRDGASAQYGSDAIAGVMNIILKDRYDYGSVTLNTGVTHKGDGGVFALSLNNGSNFGEKGFINYTISLSQVGQANRPGLVSAEADADGDLGFGAPIGEVKSFLAKKPDGGNINGAPKTTAAKFVLNGGTQFGGVEMYYNGAYVYKKVNSFANYRTPYWKPLNTGGNISIYNLLSPGQQYEGYVPTFEGDLNDYNGTIGFKSEKNGWKNDVSFTVGGNKQLYSVNNTVNFSLGVSSPTTFKPGGFGFNHMVGNIDLSKALSETVNLSFGSEFRSEIFTIFRGDNASFAGGGANSFPGFNLEKDYKNNRFNFGGYAGISADLSKDFLVDLTGRYETYSDFGNAFVWKGSTRYKFADDKATLRASFSTGFRAPSLHQTSLQLAQASFLPGGAIQIEGLIRNGGKEATLLGVEKLKAEKSTNFTVGLGLNPTKNLSFTLDYYNIGVKDRVILSSKVGATKSGTTELDKILKTNNIVRVSFFTNGIDTRTSGLDLVASYKGLQMGSGKLNVNLAGNYTMSNGIDGFKKGTDKIADFVKTPSLIKAAGYSTFDATQNALLFTSRPKFKAILGLDYTVGKLNLNLNNTMFGPTTFHQDGIDDNLDTEFLTKIVTDLGANIELAKNVTLGLNINNLLNVTPKWKFVALNTSGESVLKDPKQVFIQTNLLTFNGRYSMVTYDGSHFSQLGTTFAANLNVRF